MIFRRYLEYNLNNLLDVLNKIRPEINYLESQDFIKEGLLDSFDIVTLVAELEEQFGIFIDGEDVTPENFKNLETLESLIRRYLNNHES